MFPDERLGARAADIVRALALDLWATWQLRRKPLLIVAADVDRRAERLRSMAAADEPRLARIMSAFASVGIVLRAADRCLVRALAVQAACSREGIRVELVIGVRLHPFQAHAWVQVGDKVLVGEFEQVRLFTPIAVLG